MDFMDFYDLAVYCNTTFKGNYTQREIVENAYTYFTEYRISVFFDEPTATINTICDMLANDGSEESNDYLNKIIDGIHGCFVVSGVKK